MPLVSIVSNVSSSHEAKLALAGGLTTALCEALRIPRQHVHVHIQDGAFLSFGGDVGEPAAYITIQAAKLQIREEFRKDIVDRIMPVLQATLGCDPMRTTTFFQDVPVENIAVGNQIMVFSKNTSQSGVGSPSPASPAMSPSAAAAHRQGTNTPF